MATKVGSLSVVLGANIKQFQQAFNKARKNVGTFAERAQKRLRIVSKRIRRFAKRLQGTFKRLKAVVSAGVTAIVTAILAAPVALGFFAKRQGELMVQTERMADRLGASTRAFSQLQHAARRTGIAANDFQDIMREMVQRIGEAKVEGGEMAVGFRMIGVNLNRLIQMKPSQQFLTIAQSLNKIQNQSERTAAAAKIFGDEGTRILKLVNRGVDDIQELRREANKLGVSFDKIDAAKALAASRAFAELKAAFRGLFRQLAIKIAPVVNGIIDRINTWIQQNNLIRGSANKMVRTIISGVGSAIDIIKRIVLTGLQAAKAFAQMGNSLSWLPGISGDFTSVIANIESMQQKVKQIPDGAKLAEQGYRRLQNAAKDLETQNRSLGNSFDNSLEGMTKASRKIEQLQQQIKELRMGETAAMLSNLREQGATQQQIERIKRMIELRKQLRNEQNQDSDQSRQNQQQTELQRRAQQVFENTRRPIEKYNQRLRELNELYSQGMISAETYARAVGQTQKNFDDVNPLRKYQTRIGQLNRLVNNGIIGWERYKEGVRRAQQELRKQVGTVERANQLNKEQSSILQAGTAQSRALQFQAPRASRESRTQEKQLDLSEEQRDLLDDINRNIQRNPSLAGID
jgi:hypothetical protein